MKRLLGAALLAAALTGGTAAEEPAGALAQMRFIGGDWIQVKDGETVEERWIGPARDLMVGMSMTSSDTPEYSPSFEFMRIHLVNDKIVFTSNPGGGPPTDFTLAKSDTGLAVFENLSHDFPQRIVYELGADAATLNARIEDASGKQSVSWTYKRKAP